MKKTLGIIVLILLLVGRALWIEENHPDQWATVWQNYKDTESVGTLFSEGFNVFRGETIKRVPMSVREANTIVYQWVDDRGEYHTSYQKPTGVSNVKEIRLGDLDYQIEPSILDPQSKSDKDNP